MDATQYLTFVLRSLGYDSSKDFKWDAAWELTDKLGITAGEYSKNSKGFVRGNVAEISLAALSTSVKGNGKTLEQQIAAENAVTENVEETTGAPAELEKKTSNVEKINEFLMEYHKDQLKTETLKEGMVFEWENVNYYDDLLKFFNQNVVFVNKKKHDTVTSYNYSGTRIEFGDFSSGEQSYQVELFDEGKAVSWGYIISLENGADMEETRHDPLEFGDEKLVAFFNGLNPDDSENRDGKNFHKYWWAMYYNDCYDEMVAFMRENEEILYEEEFNWTEKTTNKEPRVKVEISDGAWNLDEGYNSGINCSILRWNTDTHHEIIQFHVPDPEKYISDSYYEKLEAMKEAD